MKKVLYLVLICLLALSISGCDNEENENPYNENPYIDIKNNQILYKIIPTTQLIHPEIEKILTENKLLDHIHVEDIEYIKEYNGRFSGYYWYTTDMYYTFDILVNNEYYFEAIYAKCVIRDGAVEAYRWSLYSFKEITDTKLRYK